MKAQGITRKSIKEQELANFFHKKLLTNSGTIITDQLDIIKSWVIKHNGKPVKAVYINKKKITIELIELSFEDQDHHFFKEVTWEHWYEIFKDQQLKFIFIQPGEDGKTNWFYKLNK